MKKVNGTKAQAKSIKLKKNVPKSFLRKKLNWKIYPETIRIKAEMVLRMVLVTHQENQ